MDEHKKLKIKNIETYAGDMAEAIESGEEGLIKRMIHEQETEEAEKMRVSPESKKNQLFTIFGAGLTVAAVVLLAALGFFNREMEGVYVAPRFEPLIFTDGTEFIDVTGFEKEGLYGLVRGQVDNFKLAPGQVVGVYLAEEKQVIDFKRFMALIKSNFPPEELEKVEGNFLIGIYGKKENLDVPPIADVFLILKVSSFLDVFEPFRTWENKMFFDLASLFGMSIYSDTDSLLLGSFEDGFLGNKNARILYDDFGNPALMYIFANDNSVVIASSVAAAEEAMERLSAGVRK